jgi:hypothetical protein
VPNQVTQFSSTTIGPTSTENTGWCKGHDEDCSCTLV